MNLRNIIGQRIRDKRKEKGWTQEELAEKTGMHPTYVGKLERGEKGATIDSLEKIVNALDVTFEELFKYIQPSTTESDENPILWQIVDVLNSKNINDQKAVLKFIDFMFEWKEK